MLLRLPLADRVQGVQDPREMSTVHKTCMHQVIRYGCILAMHLACSPNTAYSMPSAVNPTINETRIVFPRALCAAVPLLPHVRCVSQVLVCPASKQRQRLARVTSILVFRSGAARIARARTHRSWTRLDKRRCCNSPRHAPRSKAGSGRFKCRPFLETLTGVRERFSAAVSEG
jgi:hypothetical protein